MIDHTSAEAELDRQVNSWGFTMNATDYFNSLENKSFTANVAGVSTQKPMGRGRGLVDVSHSRLEKVRLAARISRLEAHSYPVGHLPTTEEILAGDPGEEIAAGLRSLGIQSTDCALSSRTTIPTVVKEDIRVDGNVPLILNGEMFRQRYSTEEDDEDEGTDGASEAERILEYDPSKPLAVQFPTIDEFKKPLSAIPESSGSELNASISSSGSSNSSKSSSKRGKKKKWTKVPVDMVLSPTKHMGYQEAGVVCGGPPLPPNSHYKSRTVYNADGMKNIK